MENREAARRDEAAGATRGAAPSRREALAIGAAAAAAVAAGALGGCSLPWAGDEDGQEAGGSGWLPLGSVVTTNMFPGNPDQRVVITARRPLTADGGEGSPDYAGCLWPFGLMSSIDAAPEEGELVRFSRDAVTSVVFAGYADDAEEAAAAALAASSEGEAAASSLIGQYEACVAALSGGSAE